MRSCLVVLGTRPEAIKLAPVIRALQDSKDLYPHVLLTAQHRELVDQVLRIFHVVPDTDLNLMRPGQTLTQTTVGVLEGVGRAIEAERPDFTLVQGDTTTVFASSLASFYHHVPVGHVEAGLRSGNLNDPFPEEANRLLTTRLAALHFAPTVRARAALLAEGVSPDQVVVTGNTVVDALQMVLREGRVPAIPEGWNVPEGVCTLLVTLHRRETWGARLEGICRAILRALDAEPNLWVFFPVHPQPRVREVVIPLLGSHSRVCLAEPLGYLDFVAAMRASYCIVTDSGGVQEEAPVLGKPVLVLRQVTERPEAIEAGTSRLVGTEEESVLNAILELVQRSDIYTGMAKAVSPYGDGNASTRIVDAVRRHLDACGASK